MALKPVKREGSLNFVDCMLQGAEEIKEVKPHTRYDNANAADIEKVMANLKKGVVRR